MKTKHPIHVLLFILQIMHVRTSHALQQTSELADAADDGDQYSTIRGVNIGGVFLIEPFIAPSLFDQFTNLNDSDRPVDEWTFCKALGKDEAKRQLEDHWSTFVTKDHLEKLAQYGVNWIRIPMGYWAFNVTDAEPFVDGQIPYIERIIEWAREIGLKVELDLHGAPGSQNGYDNSGKRGEPQWMRARANVDRTLDALAKMTQLAVKWGDVVYAVQLLNEPSRWKWPLESIHGYYNEAYDLVREISPDIYILIHDTFLGPRDWTMLLSANWTNVIVDTHLYQMFDNHIVTLSEADHLKMVTDMTQDITYFDRTSARVVVGEFSAATHDCTKYINGVGKGSRWEGTFDDSDSPRCPFSICSCSGDYGGNYREFSSGYKRFMKKYIDAQLDVFEDLAGWFYWNFRTESAPEWDFILGVEQGWIPRFPRTAVPNPVVFVPEYTDTQDDPVAEGGAEHWRVRLVQTAVLSLSLLHCLLY